MHSRNIERAARFYTKYYHVYKKQFSRRTESRGIPYPEAFTNPDHQSIPKRNHTRRSIRYNVLSRAILRTCSLRWYHALYSLHRVHVPSPAIGRCCYGSSLDGMARQIVLNQCHCHPCLAHLEQMLDAWRQRSQNLSRS